MVVHIVNKQSRWPVYIARKRFANGQFNGYGRQYRVDPGEKDIWGDNESLVYSTSSYGIQYHDNGLPYLDPCGERKSGTWTYTFTDGGMSHDQGTVL